MNGIFGRPTISGDVALFDEDGHALTRLETRFPVVYDVNTNLGSAWEHPAGLIITRQDAKRLGIEIEA